MTATLEALCQVLQGREPERRTPPLGARRAAVLMPLWEAPQGVQVVLTKRTEDLAHHAGQISFPGGAAEDEDDSLAQTALRETCEEIGVCQGLVEVVARLDQVLTITNFLVTPFLGQLDPAADFRPNPLEVERLVLVPLAKVLDPAAWQAMDLPWRGMILPGQQALVQDQDVIWGATARMLLNFRAALGPEAARIANLAGNGHNPVDRPPGAV